MTDDLREQPPPEAACPECGAQATEDSVLGHKLSMLGYAHDDVGYECRDCSHTWPHGVPIGEFDRPDLADSLRCANDACDHEYCLVHRVEHTGPTVALHLKCPECYYWTKAVRSPDDNGIALVGYPAITGATAGCDPYGYPAEGEPEEDES